MVIEDAVFIGIMILTLSFLATLALTKDVVLAVVAGIISGYSCYRILLEI